MDIKNLTGKWDYASLPKNINVGKDCYLERAEIFPKCLGKLSIGDRVKIYTWSALNIEAAGKVEIGDDSILAGAILMCAEHIQIGKGVRISYHVTIADSDFHPTDPEQRKLDAIANAPSGDRSKRPAFVTRPVIIGDDVQIGIGAFILKGVKIGKGAVVAPGAVVTSDVPAGRVAEGNPAKIKS